jgi:YidC/Oxa1 family membrane protein insertase
MEKRAFLAFALALLVLIFWDYYFGLYQVPEQQKPQEQVSPSAPSSPDTAVQPTPNLPAEALSPKTVPQERSVPLDKHFDNWTVDTPLFKGQILAPGARINTFSLKKFREFVDPASPPMEMISVRTSGNLPAAVALVHHPDLDISTRPFACDSPKNIALAAGDAPQTLNFSTEIPGKIRVDKSFTFSPDSYVTDLQIRVRNLGSEHLSDQLGVSFFFQPYSGLEESSYNVSQIASYQKGELGAHSVKDIEKKDLTLKSPVDWVGYENNYFAQAIIPLEDNGYQMVTRVLDAGKHLVQLVYLSEPFQLDANQESTLRFRLYMGPKELDQLAKAEHNLAKAVDYGWFTVIAKPLLHVLNWFYRYTHNYGIAIILLTVIIKVLFWPLTQKSFQSMQAMKKLQPKIAQLREKYGDDKEKLNQELMQLYRTYKVNPVGGCLPMVLQIPVFFALYRMLNGAVELRHMPFMLWIHDLTAPDRLDIGFSIPYLGGLPVLTILMGATMFIQQKMTPSAGDPRQEQIMLLMPVVFTVMFVNFPAGLVLYWLVNNVLSIVQQYFINRNA